MDRIAWTLAEVADKLRGLGRPRHVQSLRERIWRRSLPFLRVGERIVLLEGDWQILVGGSAYAWKDSLALGDELLAAGQLAAKLGLSPRHLQNCLRRGDLPGTLVGRSWVISSADLRSWIIENRQPASWEWSHAS